MLRIHRHAWFRLVATALVIPTIFSTTPVAWAFPTRPDDLRTTAPANVEERRERVEEGVTTGVVPPAEAGPTAAAPAQAPAALTAEEQAAIRTRIEGMTREAFITNFMDLVPSGRLSGEQLRQLAENPQQRIATLLKLEFSWEHLRLRSLGGGKRVDMDRGGAPTSAEADFARAQLTAAQERLKPVLDVFQGEQFGGVSAVLPTVVRSSEDQPMPLVQHRGVESRLGRHSNIVVARSPPEAQGTLIGVNSTPGPTFVNLTFLVPNQVAGEKPKDRQQVVADALRAAGISVKDTGLEASQNVLDKQDVALVDATTIAAIPVPNVGTLINLKILYDAGAAVAEPPPTSTTPLPVVRGSLMEPSKFTRRPKLSRPLRLGLDGIGGRTGITILRQLLLYGDPTEIEYIVGNGRSAKELAYVLQHDTEHGEFPRPITTGTDAKGEFVDVRRPDATLRVYATNIREPQNLPWGRFNVDVVADATSHLRETKTSLLPHLEAGAKRVILPNPSKESDPADFSLLIGVNDAQLPATAKIIDCASCTTNSYVPPMWVLKQQPFNVLAGDLVTVHSWTGTQRLTDAWDKKPDRGRAAARNMVITSTGAAKATAPILLLSKEQFSAGALRVPAGTGSVSVVTNIVEVSEGEELTVEDVNAHHRQLAATPQLQGIFAVASGSVGSQQIVGRSESSILLEEGTQVVPLGNNRFLVRTLYWYDNEWGYSARVADAFVLEGEKLLASESRALAAAPEPTEPGKTFIAVTAAGATIPDGKRAEIDKRVRGVIGAAFGKGQAFEFGPSVPEVKDARAKAAYELVLKAAAQAGEGVAERVRQRRIVLLANDADPSLLNDGDLRLIGSSGTYVPDGRSGPRGSHYFKLALIEEAAATFNRNVPPTEPKGKPTIDDSATVAYLAKLFAHEDVVLQAGGYVAPSPEDKRALNEGFATIETARYERWLANAEQARAKELKQVITDISNVRLGRFVTGGVIPDEAVQATRQELAKAEARGDILGAYVLAAGDDLQIHINHQHGKAAPGIQRLVVTASREALRAAKAAGLTTAQGSALVEKGYRQLRRELSIRPDAMWGVERGADPMVIAKAIGGGAGAFNRPLFRAFFHPDTHPTGRISRETFSAVVERIEDVRAGKKDRVRYKFGPGDMFDMLTLVGDHSEWMITEVHAATGRFASSNPGEPVAKVVVEPVTSDGYRDAAVNPTLILRLQSGSEAIGVATDALGQPWIGPGGPDDSQHLVATPVTLEQARKQPAHGVMHIAAYGYMQYEGRIPEGTEVVDLFNPRSVALSGLLAEGASSEAELQVTMKRSQANAAKLLELMREHGNADPFLTARGAEAVANAAKQALRARWVEIPKTELSVEDGGDLDPDVQRANARSQGRTASIIKADAGAYGHTWPPDYYSVAAEETLRQMKEQGLIKSFVHGSEGDDYETIQVHRRGADDHQIHLQSYYIFWRMVYLADNYRIEKRSEDGSVRVLSRQAIEASDQPRVALPIEKVIGAKPYGRGQDLVAESTRGRPTAELAGVTDNPEIIERMAASLEANGLPDHAAALRKGYEIYQAARASGGQVEVVKAPFSGNITGQGPGFAEMPLPAEGAVRIGAILTDKTGPAAFNIPTMWVLEQAVSRGIIRQLGGAIAVIDDTKAHKRIYLDVETEMDKIRELGANPDEFNFKRVISKAKPGWDATNWQEYLGDQIFIVTSTEKLSIITGGEYRGKDDSVLLAIEPLAKLYFEHARDHVYFTQGDGFGSHYDHPRPEPLRTAIATMQSRAVQSGLWLDITVDDQLRATEVYDDPAYRAAAARSEELSALAWSLNGSEVTPVGVGAARVESAYPLMKTTKAITAPDSKYALPTQVDAGKAAARGEWAELKGVSYQTSAKTARQVADVRHPTVAVINLDAVQNDPSLLLAGQQLFEQTYRAAGFASPKEAAQNGGIKLVLHVDQELAQADAEKLVDELLKNASEATDGAITLDRSWFAGISTPTTIVRVMNHAAAERQQAKTILLGSEGFAALEVQGYAPPISLRVFTSESTDAVVPAGAGLLAAIETAAAPDQKPPAVVKQLDVEITTGDLGMLIAPKPQTVPELNEPLALYRDRLKG